MYDHVALLQKSIKEMMDKEDIIKMKEYFVMYELIVFIDKLRLYGPGIVNADTEQNDLCGYVRKFALVTQ